MLTTKWGALSKGCTNWDRTDDSTYYLDGGTSAHTGIDMNRADGQSVVAIADGVVVENGKPWGTANNNVVVIEHTTSTGEKFLAVYGHLYGDVVAKGPISRGATVGRVQTAGTGAHLHFGIKPGAWAGVTPNGSSGSSVDGAGNCTFNPVGTVDPLSYLGARTPGTVGGGVSEGSFVAYDGHVFRIAGGAPLYVSNWSAVGGPQPVTELNAAQFNALPVYPADGTFVTVNAGFVYRFAGGAPIYVSSWDRVGGSRPTILVDQAALDQGGNPAFPWNHVRKYPADGTLVGTAPGGFVYRFAGGAPLYVSNWDAVGGPKATTQIDHAAIDQANNPSTPWNHIRRYPANGTLVTVNAGYVYRYAGGAPLYVSNWEAIGGPAATTLVDQAALDTTATGPPWNHSRPYPADGTFLNGLGQSLSWKVTGGVARPVPRTSGVLIDTAAVANAGRAAPWNHLRTSTPAATLAPLATTRTKARAKVRWALLITSSRTTSYDLRWRVNARAWRYPDGWQELATGPVVKTRLHVGKRYCFAIRAHNAAGIVGPWSAHRCTRRTA